MQTSLCRAWRAGAALTRRTPLSLEGLRRFSDEPASGGASGAVPEATEDDRLWLKLEKVPRSALRTDVQQMINNTADTSDMRIEFGHRYRPLAWWVPFKSNEQREKAIEGVKDSHVIARRINQNSEAMQSTKGRVNDVITQSGACFVIAENVDYAATIQDCWKFLLGFDHLPRPVWFQNRRHDSPPSGSSLRYVLFAMKSPEEAYRLVREKGGSTICGAPVQLRVIP